MFRVGLKEKLRNIEDYFVQKIIDYLFQKLIRYIIAVKYELQSVY